MTEEEDSTKELIDVLTSDALPPAFSDEERSADELRSALVDAIKAWLLRTPSVETRKCYDRDLKEFMRFCRIEASQPEALALVRPEHVANWREHLHARNLANSTIRRKLTVIRSLFSYLQIYGYAGANPAHGKFVKAPAVPRDGKTVALSPKDCRRLMDAPDPKTVLGLRDRAIFSVLAYSACRVGELCRLKVSDFKIDGEHRILSLLGKGGKERNVPLHIEAAERLKAWINIAKLDEDRYGPLFRPVCSARGHGEDGFKSQAITVRGVEYLVRRYVETLGLDPAVTVHSFRVTALTTARERGADIVDLQDFAGHADPRTTLTYVRNRDRLSKSPAYVLKY